MNDLVQRAKAGDKAAEEEIFRTLLVRFSYFARQRLMDGQAADEIAQKACIAILEKYKEENITGSFEAWAYGVFRMKMKNHFHMASKERNIIIGPERGEWDAFSGASFDPDLERQLGNCLRKILKVNRLYARILNLHYQGYDGTEIAARLGIERNHYYVLLNRARNKMRICLDKGDM